MATIVAVTSPEICDRCGAQAYWRYDRNDEASLCFCGHHSHEHMRALQAAGFEPSMLVVRSHLDEVNQKEFVKP